MDEQKLTDDQKEKLKKLRKSYVLRTMKIQLKMVLSFFVSMFIITAINVFYVHNSTFSGFSSFVTSIMIFRSFISSLAQEHDRVREELKKILGN